MFLLDKGAKDEETALLMAAYDENKDLVARIAARQSFKPEYFKNALQKVSKNSFEAAQVIIGAVPASQLECQNPAKLDADNLKSYSGTYKSEKGIAYVFAVNNGRLVGYSIDPPALMALKLQMTDLDGWARTSGLT